MNNVLQLFVIALFVGWMPSLVWAAPPAEPVRIYLDADTTGVKASTVSIERGIRTALAEDDNMLAGRPVELVVLNHRGNSARSLANLKTFLADPDALVLFSGLHSPPLLSHRQFINDNAILVLDPWAAAGPITRPSGSENWIFRLSVDDSKAGAVIVKRAVDERYFRKPALLLEDTGWGKSNQKTMTTSLDKRGLAPVSTQWFNWGLKEIGAKRLLRDINKSGADVIFLVANAPEGKTICKAMHDMPPDERLPIVSHWGITGGDFPQVVTREMRKELNLEFIQTSFSFLDMGSRPFPNKVFALASDLFPKIQTPADITAPTGFIHAYDLTRILGAAVNQAGLTDDMKTNREKIHMALENLTTPVQGLIKNYSPPFRPYTVNDMDAHEALGTSNFTFGRYGDRNEIRLVK